VSIYEDVEVLFRIEETGGNRDGDQTQDGQSSHRSVGKRHGLFRSEYFCLRVPQTFMLEDVMKAITAIYTSSGADSLLRMCPRSMEMKEVAIEEVIAE
jgi:hypothetical protein